MRLCGGIGATAQVLAGQGFGASDKPSQLQSRRERHHSPRSRGHAPLSRILARKMSHFLTNPTLTPCGFDDQVLFLEESAESRVQPCGARTEKASGAIVFFRLSPILEQGANTIPRPTLSADSQIRGILHGRKAAGRLAGRPWGRPLHPPGRRASSLGARQASLTKGGKGAGSNR